jgi:DNA-binding transcriptional LysR family regulator
VAGQDYDCDFDHIYTRQEIAEFPLILLERKASSRVFLEQDFLRSGITLNPEIELSSRQLLVSLARIGLGVAGVTLEFVRDALDAGDIRLLKTDFTIPARSVDMCTLRDVTPTAAASAFMEMVRQGDGPAG